MNTETKPHAYLTTSNSGGIEISVNDSADGLSYRYNNGEAPEAWVEAPIEFTDVDNDGEQLEDSKAYFQIEGNDWKYFLDTFMKIQY